MSETPPLHLPSPDPAPPGIGGLFVTEMSPSGGWLSPSGFRLISLKVLNSVVLLGKSCQYVRGAKMEEKLFDPPPSSAPGKPAGKSQSKRKPSQGRSGSSPRFSASFSEELVDCTR